MLTNDIKKGTRIRLRNGWEAEMADNKKGNIRLAKVFGLYTELGSVYAWDIVQAQMGEEWVDVELTPKQEKSMYIAKRMGL